jgi:hypothetical protein
MHISSDSWSWRERAILIAIILIGVALLAILVSTDHAGAAPVAGNKGGCGRNNMVSVSCNVSDAGVGFVSGDCDWGYWFSRVSTRRTFRIGQIVNVYGCEGLNQELYAPIRISK